MVSVTIICITDSAAGNGEAAGFLINIHFSALRAFKRPSIHLHTHKQLTFFSAKFLAFFSHEYETKIETHLVE